MTFDYSKLSGRINEYFQTRARFSRKMGWSERTTSLKLGNKVPWKQTDIAKASILLEICPEEIPSYFFNAEVQKIELSN